MESIIRLYIQQPEQPTEILTEEEQQIKNEEILQEIARREQDNTPQWLTIVDNLAHGDRTKWDFFFDMPVVEFLNTYGFDLARKKELAKIIEVANNDSPHSAIVTALRHILFTR